MATIGRHHHRSSSSILWLPVIVSALLGVTLGSWVTSFASGIGSSAAEPITNQVAEPPRTPPSSTIVRSVGSIGFAEPATGPADLSLTALPPEKVKGGVRLTIALTNNTGAPVTIDTGELGPHDPRFNGAAVPMTMTPATKKLMPGEGYTYQCVFKLPTMDLGELAFTIGAVTVTGQAAGD